MGEQRRQRCCNCSNGGKGCYMRKWILASITESSWKQDLMEINCGEGLDKDFIRLDTLLVITYKYTRNQEFLVQLFPELFDMIYNFIFFSCNISLSSLESIMP